METIMIIEDDRRIREELSLLLISAGYTALAVTEFTEEPIKLLKENHPDLILMDINIPGGSGVSLCAQIRKISQVPVIFVTGRTGAMDELEALMTGGDDYITKPYQAPVLLAHIRAVLRRTGKSGTMQEAELECRGVRLSLKDASV
ncbi:response regulator transcription factor, partial [Blautia sp. CAG:257]